MIFVDTNILIRLMTDDVPSLRRQAEKQLAGHKPGELFVPDIVLTELFFVLQNNPLYRFSRQQVCKLLQELLESPQLVITGSAVEALELADKHPKLDFTDCLLAVYAGQKKNRLLSFDKDLLKALD